MFDVFKDVSFVVFNCDCAVFVNGAKLFSTVFNLAKYSFLILFHGKL